MSRLRPARRSVQVKGHILNPARCHGLLRARLTSLPPLRTNTTIDGDDSRFPA